MALLTFHFLNVGHGDSIVVEFEDEGGRKTFGVIDSHHDGEGDPPALNKLRQLGAQELSFVALTHPHADHFTGLHAVLAAYAGRIGAFYTFPLDPSRDRIKKYAASYAAAVAGASGKVVRIANEIVRIISMAARELNGVWEAPAGTLSVISPPGFDAVEIKLLQPPAVVRGPLYQAIDAGVIQTKDDMPNDLSMALEFVYAGKKVVLGGDATARNWRRLRQRYGPDRPQGSLQADVAKLPHHGSAHDCEPLVLDFLFRPSEAEKPIGVVSADGRSHPSKSVIEGLMNRGVLPYCTNLASFCRAGEVQEMIVDGATDPMLLRFVNQSASTSHTRVEPCQGELSISIDATGVLSVSREFENACPFRGDYGEIEQVLGN